MALETILTLGGLAAFLLLMLAVVALRARRRRLRDAESFEALRDQGLHLPASLHPVIDPAICMGSLACVRACPEGDILGIVDGAAHLIEGSRCIGHGRCAAECPVGAIRLVFGTSERGVDLPEVSGEFESSRPGVYVVGELGGMGLIRNAVRQGVEAVEYLAPRLREKGGELADVAIVGAGPAGLAAAAACGAAGLSYRLLERERFGGTVANFPRQKLVMTEPVEVPGYGRFGKREMRKEELLEAFEDVARRTGVKVEEGVVVEGIEGELGRFTLRTSAGTVGARRVILAVGRRGIPRRLGVPGEALPKVTYRLIEPEQYAGRKVLVVGGGDSALEAAIMLAEETDAEVRISYRGEAFGRCRPANRARIDALIAEGRVHGHLGTQVSEVTPDAVVLQAGGAAKTLENDYVIVNAGGELPAAFLEKVGVQVRRHTGDEDVHARRPERELEDRASRRLALALFTAGTAIAATLAVVGHRYYLLSAAARHDAVLHEALKPAGWWGHGIGIAATLFMLLNFVYAARKRLGWLRGSGPIRDWLTFHLFVGFMSPVLIAFHAAFQSRNLLATVTAAALAVVVTTGIIGRFIWGLVPVAGGRAIGLPMLEAQRERHRARILRSVPDGPLSTWARRPPAPAGSLLGHLVSRPLAALRLRSALRAAPLRDPRDAAEVREAALHLARLETQVAFHRSLRLLLSGWRAFHVSLAVTMLLVIGAHVALSLLLGYKWIFS